MNPTQVRARLSKWLASVQFGKDSERKDLPGSGGLEEVWKKKLASGVVVVRVVTLRHLWSRVQFDIGLTLPSLTNLEQMIPALRPMAFGRRWYPYFQFGWSLGQAALGDIEALRLGVVPVVEGTREDGDLCDGVIAFEGNNKSIALSDDASRVNQQLADVVREVEEKALPIFERCASDGTLQSTLFANRWRMCVNGPWKFARAMGLAICGEQGAALALLEDENVVSGDSSDSNRSLVVSTIRSLAP